MSLLRTSATPNQALQRTRLRVTAPASAAAFPPTMQVPRRSGVSLSLRSLGHSTFMEHSELFSQAVRDCQELPADVRSHVAEARGVEESSFDESYIEFLDEQIRLSPRGPEWTEILRRRRECLRPFCRVPLLSGHIRVGRFDTWVKVDPKRRAVVFWQQLEYDTVA